MAARGDLSSKPKSTNEFIRWLSELNKNSGMIAGGKGANLAEMYNARLPVPPAFVITTKAYYHFIEKAGIKNQIEEILESIDVDYTQELEDKAKEIRELIIKAEMPQDLKEEIIEAYENLSVDKSSLEAAGKYALSILKNSIEPVFVAVRSSATTEDLDDSSFAGQQESYLNVKGNSALILHVKKVLASLFTARAIYYRKKRGFSKDKFALSVIVQRMIDSDKSGVMFTKNPVKNNNNIVIEAVYGLGEGIVSGMIKPDHYEVSPDLNILQKSISEKKIALTRNSQGDTEQVRLSPSRSASQVLEDREIKAMANYAVKIENHYGKPQDIEFAVESGEIYIVQSRPITTQVKSNNENEIKGEVLLEGLGASPGISSGRVRIIHDLSQLDRVQAGDILVTEMTNPDMVVTMQKSSGIITDEGGITSHAAIVSREMGIPAVVGTGNATKTLHDGQIVTVDGFTGRIYEGSTGNEKKAEIIPIKEIKTRTKIKLILDLPDFAERAAQTKINSVGLLRLEGIIASSGKHPMLFVKQNNMKEYESVIESGIKKISNHFEEVWIRTSDIRSDEFSNLEGSPKQREANPMLGMHGIRFSLKNPKILEAEFSAIKSCAESHKNKIFGIMMPQIISVEEVREAKAIAQKLGLLNLKNIKLGIMVETPAACLIIKDLLKEGLQFISLGTNDLTQYTLAIDRGNEQVQYLYNETHPAMLNAIKRVIRTCNEFEVESSICGQAGSNPEMVKFLIESGISSISVNADAAHNVAELVSKIESGNGDKEVRQKESNKKEVIEHKENKESSNNIEEVDEGIDSNNQESEEDENVYGYAYQDHEEKKVLEDDEIPEYIAGTSNAKINDQDTEEFKADLKKEIDILKKTIEEAEKAHSNQEKQNPDIQDNKKAEENTSLDIF